MVQLNLRLQLARSFSAERVSSVFDSNLEERFFTRGTANFFWGLLVW